jgi:hypothetical protein
MKSEDHVVALREKHQAGSNLSAAPSNFLESITSARKDSARFGHNYFRRAGLEEGQLCRMQAEDVDCWAL